MRVLLLAFALFFDDKIASAPEPPAEVKLTKQQIQYERSLQEEVPRIPDDEELRRLIEKEELVPIAEDETLRIDPRLDSQWRYLRPFALRCLRDLAAEYYAQFGEPLQANSAVRTETRQKNLARRNSNARVLSAPSTHPTGATFDIAKKPKGKYLARKKVAWLLSRLREMEGEGLIVFQNEWKSQAVIHVWVSKNYTEQAARK